MWVNLRNTLGPLFLILVCPPFVMVMWFTNTKLEGSFSTLWNSISTEGVVKTLYYLWQPYFWGSGLAWAMIGGFILFEAALMRLLPGKEFQGPISPKGYIPTYKENGLLAFVITIVTFSFASFGLHLFPATILYDNLGSILGALNIFSLVFCVFLYIKGRVFPSTKDASVTKNFLFDYYWGVELYPQAFGWHIKQLITCRLGMMSWGLLLISYCAKQAELTGLANSMVISVSLQGIYIAKFFLWEKGYLRSLDIMHDRAGFYICWGCLVWVPCIYTSPSMFLVLHPVHLSLGWACLIFTLGAISILVNYSADKQRMRVRETAGNCKIWGKKPTILLTHYKTAKGDIKTSILLASGWWGISRHFHYIPEVAGAFFWSVPALFTHFAPYFYVCFLTILLMDRAFRDDRRCAKKYGLDWDKYCSLVPYKIIPFLI
ncbi:7-dehydrocholesterol reductase [Legionella micdadei]|uniref:7-dehydrocholesterol reductase n=1 Tax=Legionella micdadei TaxID=451 RepID=A0A098GG99_LEGMI|nr:7-dehydrocholesterol reductase [Legionella micdadei]ARH00674.1 7-dehydrocholesterol reductase [Legionella micdadei]KTD26793.1 7-dehydrocholesterol reductase [Legionella micdadei]NSL18292.1 7-dehydrocholesterol reductase [Legionella micdadei]CEG61509.1 7-dehydrocholesterol reductase [Legionella micdadei]SCY44611.1 7-dehydrocholesterol reductase [Legionella micdadei]